ncbi:MAG: hypothetical protein AAFQ65_04495 [Myxococcota bacterium]
MNERSVEMRFFALLDERARLCAIPARLHGDVALSLCRADGSTTLSTARVTERNVGLVEDGWPSGPEVEIRLEPLEALLVGQEPAAAAFGCEDPHHPFLQTVELLFADPALSAGSAR